MPLKQNSGDKLMNSIIKYSIIAAISAASLPAGAKVYECNVGGVTVYTSRPSANCHTPDLPRIGSYTSIAPRVAPPPREPAAQASAAPGSPRRASMSTNRAANAPNEENIFQVASPWSGGGRQTADAGLPKPSGNSGRRTILEQELANEQQALASAQNELSAARAQKNQNRASQLTANIQDRRQNIQALQRELSRM